MAARADYTDWGEVRRYTDITVNGGFRRLLPEITYATHEYDNVLNQFYAKARMYDAENKRFTAVDLVKGSVTDPISMVQYLYVADNPTNWVDLLGLVKINNSELIGAISASDLGGRSSRTYIFADEVKSYLKAYGVYVEESRVSRPELTTGGFTQGNNIYYNFAVIQNGQKYTRELPAMIGNVSTVDSMGNVSVKKEYFVSLSCVQSFSKELGLEWKFTELDKVFRAKDFSAIHGRIAACNMILGLFMNGTLQVDSPWGGKRQIRYSDYSYLGQYAIRSYLRVASYKNHPMLAEISIITAAAALKAKEVSAPFAGAVVPIGPFVIPIAPFAFSASFALNLLIAKENALIPDGEMPSYSDVLSTFGSEIGKHLDKWLKSKDGQAAEKAIAEFLSLSDSDYMFLMKDPATAHSFADDVEYLRAIELNSGSISLFRTYIPDYVTAYYSTAQQVININNKWKESSSAMKQYINLNYEKYLGELSQDVILSLFAK